jgi:hypothetical protein
MLGLESQCFYEQVAGVKVFLLFSFIGHLFLLLFVSGDPRSVLPRVSIRTLSEPLGALCHMGSEGDVDSASFRPTL